MAREKPDEPASGDIPAWFMTYSDVITLLMTFFILLMTFSTTEPENFGRMQVVMFGGGNSSGVARKQKLMEQDGLVVRIRPSSSRIAKEGSETPPEMTAPARRSVSKGIDALDREEPLAASERFQVNIPISMLRDDNSQPTSYALGLARMLGRQMTNVPVDVRFLAPSVAEAETGVQLASAIYETHNLAPGRLSVSTVDLKEIPDRHIGIRMTRIAAAERN